MLEMEGMDELLSRLTRIGVNVDEVIDDALTLAAENLKTEMKNACPVDEGKLRDSIEISDITGEGYSRTIKVGPDKHTNWRAKFLEFGHKTRDKSGTVTNTHVRTNQSGDHIITTTASRRGRNNSSTKTVPAYPFIEPAHLRTMRQNKEIIANKIREAINR